MKIIMLKFIPLILILLVFNACKKDDQVCESYTELNDRQHLCDLSALNQYPQFLDTLAKYPQLRVNSIVNDEYMLKMNCDVFYGNLILFFEGYEISKGKKEGYVFGGEEVLMPMNVDTQADITFKDAIQTARSEVSFQSCINYRLGLLPVAEESSPFISYKLAWKISDQFNTQFVIVDAKNGSVLLKDDGKRTTM